MPERAWSARIVLFSFVFSFTSSRALTTWLKTFESFHLIHMVIFMCVSPRLLIIPLYFLHFLTSLIFFLQSLKFVVNLHTPQNESMDSTEEFSLSTGYEPKAHDFYETSVEPYMQLLDSPPLFSNEVSSADPDYDDATLEDMHASPSTSSASLSLSTRRLVCQSVVFVNVR